MSDFGSKHRRNNPLERMPVALLPPAQRSRKAHDLTRAAAQGRFALHRCSKCSTFAYPAPEACRECLSSDFDFVDVVPTGTLLSNTSILKPADNFFRERAPWPIGLVKLDCGPIVLCHLHSLCVEEMGVALFLKLDKAGQAVLYAAPAGRVDLASDREWKEMTASPEKRRILITDGRNPVTTSLVRRLIAAQAETVFVGVSDIWRPHPDLVKLAEADKVVLLPLDMSDEKSVANMVRDYGGKIEIVVNTSEHIRPGGLLAPNELTNMRDAMEAMVFGPMRLSRAVVPAMKSRGADGAGNAVAWVNLLSVFGQAPVPDLPSYSVAQAAAFALAQHIRGELMQSGIRFFFNVAATTENDWYQTVPQPKLGFEAVANAVVQALQQGLEEVHVGEFAKDISQRIERNAKAVERELFAHK